MLALFLISVLVFFIVFSIFVSSDSNALLDATIGTFVLMALLGVTCLLHRNKLASCEYEKPKILCIDKTHVVAEYQNEYYDNKEAEFVNFANEDNVYMRIDTYVNHFGAALTPVKTLVLLNEEKE